MVLSDNTGFIPTSHTSQIYMHVMTKLKYVYVVQYSPDTIKLKNYFKVYILIDGTCSTNWLTDINTTFTMDAHSVI